MTESLKSICDLKNSSKKDIFTAIYVMQNRNNLAAGFIYDIVASLGEGFVVDIAKKALEAEMLGKQNYISEKQAWCVIYAFVKISDDAIAKWYEAYCAEGNNAEESTEYTDEVEVLVEDKAVRIWNFNAQHHILNVHYVDGSQKRCRVHPKLMGPIYQAIRQNIDVRSMIAEIAETYPHESYFNRRQLTADEERYYELEHMREMNILDIDQENEYMTLLNKDVL